jgi:hypothetical protein
VQKFGVGISKTVSLKDGNGIYVWVEDETQKGLSFSGAW